MRNIVLTETSAICFIKQSNYMQLFGCVSGEMRIIISPPDQAPLLGTFINNVSNFDATKLLDKVPIELQFVEIILRCGNMIYIPYDWHYFIYKSVNTSSTNSSANNKANTTANADIGDIVDIANQTDTIIIDCLNKSILCSI
jgi:hypothetical protein